MPGTASNEPHWRPKQLLRRVVRDGFDRQSRMADRNPRADTACSGAARLHPAAIPAANG
jgi:hypothetical protein